jgi:hypothetical protein
LIAIGRVHKFDRRRRHCPLDPIYLKSYFCPLEKEGRGGETIQKEKMTSLTENPLHIEVFHKKAEAYHRCEPTETLHDPRAAG